MPNKGCIEVWWEVSAACVHLVPRLNDSQGGEDHEELRAPPLKTTTLPKLIDFWEGMYRYRGVRWKKFLEGSERSLCNGGKGYSYVVIWVCWGRSWYCLDPE
jgi:hypothetical protein